MYEIETPSEIYIGSLRWSIDWNAKLKSGTLGLCESSDFEIKISKHLKSDDSKRSTLLHEIIHAIYFTYGFKPSQKDAHEHEEEVVAFVSSALYDTLVRNPSVAYFIFFEIAEEDDEDAGD